MHNTILFVAILLLAPFNSKSQSQTFIYESENIRVEQLTTNTFRHISFLSTEDFGKVSCNGMIVIDKNEALIFDTPANDRDSRELIGWVEETLKCKVVGIVVTHFHNDCLGGLAGFHERNIPSYASFKTIELAKSNGVQVPHHAIDKYSEIEIGSKKVINEFLGEGHTRDNIVSYFPDDQVLFGGCLIKSLGAGKGFLGDANIYAWSNTVRAVKSRYSDVKVVIPGHGQPGNSDLLDYTIELFKID